MPTATYTPQPSPTPPPLSALLVTPATPSPGPGWRPIDRATALRMAALLGPPPECEPGIAAGW